LFLSLSLSSSKFLFDFLFLPFQFPLKRANAMQIAQHTAQKGEDIGLYIDDDCVGARFSRLSKMGKRRHFCWREYNTHKHFQIKTSTHTRHTKRARRVKHTKPTTQLMIIIITIILFIFKLLNGCQQPSTHNNRNRNNSGRYQSPKPTDSTTGQPQKISR